MTLSLAWIRNKGGLEELILASDSRLSGGRSWDCCPKIVALPRQDAAVAFAGGTDDAYPMILQMVNTVRMHPPSMDRSMDIEEMKGHIVRVFNGMRNQISDLPVGQKEPSASEAVLILGGFSTRRMRFKIWTLFFDPNLKAFTFRPATKWRGDKGNKCVTFSGCHTDDAKKRLIALLKSKGKIGSGGLDMEPLEVLRDMIRDGSFRTIGGPPQLTKVYRHSNHTPFGIKWKVAGTDRICVHGRPLLDYEAPHYPILDTDSMKISHVYQKSDPNSTVSVSTTEPGAAPTT